MRWLLPLLLLAGCANDVPLADAPIPSVRWEHHDQHSGSEPICYDAIVTKSADKIRCEWTCHAFWTNTHGAGRYYVSRSWILTEGQWVSGQWFPYPQNADEQSWPCQ